MVIEKLTRLKQECQKKGMPAILNSGPADLDKWFSSDAQFNRQYPVAMNSFAGKHWSPLNVAKQAAGFLAAEKGVKVLDIGSGIGKFCLAASYYKPDAFYYGIEQRKDLVCYAETARKNLGLDNISFTHGNFTQLDLKYYDHFYFFNSFYENLAASGNIDNAIPYSGELYNYYSHILYKQLERKPAGTRLATFHSMENEIPPGFHVVGSDIENILKFWIKV